METGYENPNRFSPPRRKNTNTNVLTKNWFGASGGFCYLVYRTVERYNHRRKQYMEMISFLPLLGGVVPLSAGGLLLLKKGLRESTQIFFYLSLITIGIFGVFETLAYISSSKDTALLLLKISKAAAFSSSFLFMSFATLIRGEKICHKIISIPFVVLLVLAWLFVIEDIQKVSWGWEVTFNKGLVVMAYIMVILMMSIGLRELRLLLKQLKEDQSSFYHTMRIITLGFLLLLITPLFSNMLVGLDILNLAPLFSVFQIIPTLIITQAYIFRKNGNKI